MVGYTQIQTITITHGSFQNDQHMLTPTFMIWLSCVFCTHGHMRHNFKVRVYRLVTGSDLDKPCFYKYVPMHPGGCGGGYLPSGAAAAVDDSLEGVHTPGSSSSHPSHH